MPQKPWEKYQTQQPVEAGPWTKYAPAAPAEDALSLIKAQQAAKYPSAQERGLPTSADLRSLPQRIMAGLSGETMLEQNPGLLAGPVEAFGAVPMAPGVTALQAFKSLLPSSILPKSIPGIPSTARAGAKFEQIMGKAKDVPLDLTEASQSAARAKELAGAAKVPGRGSQMPKVLKDFLKTTEAGNAMTYEVGRDFASNAGALSAKEATATNALMKRQVNEFAAAMKNANREAAAKVGMGEIYDAAMKEYRQAKSLTDAAAVLKKWGIRVALTAAGLKFANEIVNPGH